MTKLLRYISFAFVVATGMMFRSEPLRAQGGSKGTCGVVGQAQASPTITYDPFSPSGLTQVTIPMVLTRSANGAAKTQTVNFVFTKPTGAPNYQITYNGTSVLYTEGALMGRPLGGSQTSGEIHYNFGGSTAPDQSTPFNLVVSVPPSVDLSAGQPINFDIYYVCSGTGGMADVSTPTKQASAIQINVNVLSALQASYVGPALDFGEVGERTDAEVATNPGTKTGYIRVASSGPYSVNMTSGNGYRLRYPGSSVPVGTAATNDTLRYQAIFAGHTRSPSNVLPITQICNRAGLAGTPPSQGILVPIEVKLLDGGQGRNPAPNYQDTLTVTITPLVAPQAGINCG
jgi:hypothetical protein